MIGRLLFMVAAAALFGGCSSTAVPPPVKRAPLGTVSMFSTPFQNMRVSPGYITPGPDGTMWFFAEFRIWRITTSGAVSEVPIGQTGFTNGILGSDGSMWLLREPGAPLGPDAGCVDRLKPDGSLTEFCNGIKSQAVDITVAPSGNVWFTEYTLQSADRLTPDGSVARFAGGTIFTGEPLQIVALPGGTVWTVVNIGEIRRLTETGETRVVKIEEDGARIGAFVGARGAVAGPDGNLWFTDNVGPSIDRVTPDGVVTKFPVNLPQHGQPYGLAVGPDGNLWFTEVGVVGRIGRMTLDGSVTDFPTGSNSVTLSIAAGPDGGMWFLDSGNAIGRIETGGPVRPAAVRRSVR